MDYLRQFEIYSRIYRKQCDKMLFDITKENWLPSCDELETFCRKLYSDLVGLYRELEKTQEYKLTGECLMASDCLTGETIAFTISGGKTRSESCATHGTGWELQRLLEDRKANPYPFDFRFLLVGYKEINSNYLPIAVEYLMLGIEDETIH